MRKKTDRAETGRSGVRDIARMAGVSPATVSRVLNQSANVNAETRARIQAVLDSVNYVRDGVARSLTSGRSGSVAVIVPALGNSVYSDAVEAIERRLQVSRYHLLTASSGYDPRREYEVARTLIERGVDGLILVGNDHVPELYDLVRRSALPVIQTFTDDPSSKLPSVGFDNYGPVSELVKFVADLGHRDFAVLHSPVRHNDRISARLQAILTALNERGIDVPPDRIVEAGYTVAAGRAGMRALLSGPRTFTAVACTGDVLAVGAVIEARSAGVDIPGEMSITGFHDYDLAAQIEPPLTTVHAPVREMSVAAAEYLLSCIAGENPPKVRSLPTALVVRKSVGAVKSKAVA
ncbi:substrate-binding domain-containing protein [Leptospira interrogans]